MKKKKSIEKSEHTIKKLSIGVITLGLAFTTVSPVIGNNIIYAETTDGSVGQNEDRYGGYFNQSYNIQNSSVKITENGHYLIYGNKSETSNTIMIEPGLNVTITLRDVNIKSDCPFKLNNDNPEQKIRLTLLVDGTNRLTATHENRAALEVNSANETIIDGRGELIATGGSYGAGIGGGTYQAGDNITINGGIIRAIGDYAAGIGGGDHGGAHNITINGGVIDAKAVWGQAIGRGGSGGMDNESNINKVRGIFIEDGYGYVRGDVTLPGYYEIPQDSWLVVEFGATLTINEGDTIVANGYLQNRSTVINHGTIINNSFISNEADFQSDSEITGRIDGKAIRYNINMYDIKVGDRTYNGVEQYPKLTIDGHIFRRNSEYSVISESNIINAGTKDSDQAPTIVIEGKGEQYCGRKEIKFNILKKPVDIYSCFPHSASSLVYGQKLSDSRLSGASVGMGTYEFKYPNKVVTEVSDEGQYIVVFNAYDDIKKNYEGLDNPIEHPITVVVRKAPVNDFHFPTASEIRGGQPLSASKLNGGSTKYGLFSWVNPDTIPTVENDGYEVQFTPYSSMIDKYDIKTTIQKVALTVNQLDITDTMEVTLTTGDNCHYNQGEEVFPESIIVKKEQNGEELQLNTDYTLEYSNNTEAGTANVTIKPVTTSQYRFSEKTINYQIQKATAPEITAPTASSIDYGAPITASHLNGGSTEYGSFAWENDSELPNVDNDGFNVIFTPNEKTLANYDIATQTIKIPLTVTPLDYSDTLQVIVTAPEEGYYYKGEAVTPKNIEVKTYVDGFTLEEGTDYTISYQNNDQAGTASYTINPVATSNFTFTQKSGNFEIIDYEKVKKEHQDQQNNAKDEISNLDGLTDEEKNEYKQIIDDVPIGGDTQPIVEEAKQKSEDTINKNNAKDEISNLPGLTDEEKDGYKEQIDALPIGGDTQPIIEEAKQKSEDTINKNNAKDEISNLPGLTDEEKDGYKGQIDELPIGGDTQPIIEEAKQKSEDTINKNNAKEQINILPGINDQEKEEYIKQVDALPIGGDVQPIVDEATKNSIDGMNKHQAHADIEQLKGLTDEEKDGYIKQIDALPIGGDVQPIVDEATQKSTDAINAHKAKVDEAIAKINKLPYLTDELKQDFINQLNEVAIGDYEQLEKIVENATKKSAELRPIRHNKKPKNQWHEENGHMYYYDKDGKMITGWFKLADHWYYFNEQGIMQIGWFKDADHWYFFNKKGQMQVGWLKDQNYWYYLKENGQMAQGWEQIDGTYYLFKSWGSMTQNEWEQYNGEWYYFNTSGAMVHDEWVNYNNAWYYLKADGKMAIDEIINGYKIDKMGVWVK